MSFIEQYREDVLPPREPVEIVDVEIISERKIDKVEATTADVGVFSEKHENTVQEVNPVKKVFEIGDKVSCLIPPAGATEFAVKESKVIRVSAFLDQEKGKIRIYLLDTGDEIHVAASLDVALEELEAKPSELPESDLISIHSQKYTKKGFGKTWVIDKLWKKISVGKRHRK